MAETMRRWTMDATGRNRLTLATTPVPRPAPGEILVKVSAVSLNYRDKLVIETGMGLPLEHFRSFQRPTWPAWWKQSAPVRRGSSRATA
jgi:NADPH:quinone reductase-like Zn-dependent oxidoreductase